METCIEEGIDHLLTDFKTVKPNAGSNCHTNTLRLSAETPHGIESLHRDAFHHTTPTRMDSSNHARLNISQQDGHTVCRTDTDADSALRRHHGILLLQQTPAQLREYLKIMFVKHKNIVSVRLSGQNEMLIVDAKMLTQFCPTRRDMFWRITAVVRYIKRGVSRIVRALQSLRVSIALCRKCDNVATHPIIQ